MGHLIKNPESRRSRLGLWVYDALERLVLTMLPRGPLKKRLLARIDQALKPRHPH